MISIMQSVTLGAIEGLTEFLPISSTAHLILYNYFTGVDITDASVKTFQIAVQLGAILAVIFYYFKDLIKIEKIKLLLAGVAPTLLLGLIFAKSVSHMQELPLLIAIMMILGGVIILYVERLYKSRLASNRITQIDYKKSVTLGLVQSLAMIPGVSRSGAMIIYGLYKNYDREVIAKYTFLLAVPTMIAATGYSILKNREVILSSGGYASIMIGLVTSFVVAMFVVKYALPMIKKYSFVPFGYYRIALGLIILMSLYI